MFEKIKKLFKRNSDDVVIGEVKSKYGVVKSFFEIAYKFIGIAIGLIVIYNLNNMYGLTDKFVRGEHLGVVIVSGVISADSDASAAKLGEGLKDAFEEKDSKAVVMVIRSGGGEPYQSERLFREIQYLKDKHPNKKLYAVVESIGASAAYHIASAADEIIVGETTMIGSIGVILSNYDIRQLMDKVGVKDRTMTAGENKALLSYTKELTEPQRKHVDRMLTQVHAKFIEDVKVGRKGKIKDSPEMFSGLVWVGKEAVELGVADRIGDINMLKRELKVEKLKDYSITSGGFGSLFGSSVDNLGQSIGKGIVGAVSEKQQLSLQ